MEWPPWLKSQERPAIRVDPKQIHDAAESAATQVLGDNKWIAYATTSNIYVSPAFLAKDVTLQDRALNAMVQRISTIAGIAFASRTDALQPPCSRYSHLAHLACRSIHSSRSGQIYFAPAEFSIMSEYAGGTGHGSPNSYDTVVPIVVYGPNVPAKRHDGVVSMLQVAPTIAKLLKISPPSGAREPPLL